MKRQGGFTLIELVVVIVILGILAVTAAPRFLNLQDDARNASLEGLKGAMAGATGIVYGRAAIDGVETIDGGSISGASGDTITTTWGYPEASENGIGKSVVGLSDGSDWAVVSGSDATKYSIRYTFADSKETDKCYVQYAISSAQGSEPKLTVIECE
ncbi:type II secretion system protein [Vibrio renipiscarius]|uniref:MSHA biogenesis protein MshA n=1 Tax=Vibrio renipiscarius TaxID=1461322 RepID=A0A0C2KG42_9VIBR|nr:type II secretion system protein [Vibrio renipiscarius]KII77572.1 MSHA biogenesis protein MshA [Vibrio renipiscarius]KII81148.1 MSHA biogenesis protein MshA [Vibrio renipiscarius]